LLSEVPFMTITLTSREFNRNPSAAKRAAEKEPVIITDRGRPRFVLGRLRPVQKRRKVSCGRTLHR
jgi:hypothetical protein